jgi:RNA polymerase sigma-70 factor (ECF subfamily)
MAGTAEPNWNAVVEELGPRLYRYFCAAFPDELSADLVQETLIRLVRKFAEGQFNEGLGTISSFAFGIAFHIRQEARKAQVKDSARRSALTDADLMSPIPSSESQLIAKEQEEQLRKGIAQLSDAEQEVVLLLIDRDLSMDDIADILVTPLNTVKSHIHRAKAKLKSLINKE